jgi:hypothetical protein
MDKTAPRKKRLVGIPHSVAFNKFIASKPDSVAAASTAPL